MNIVKHYIHLLNSACTFHEDIGYFARYDIFLHLKHTVHLTVVKQLCTYFIDDLAFVLHLYIFNRFIIAIKTLYDAMYLCEPMRG